ncbi:MAG: hypothetical protein ACRDF8_01985 [Chloroflexota bacterium]
MKLALWIGAAVGMVLLGGGLVLTGLARTSAPAAGAAGTPDQGSARFAAGGGPGFSLAVQDVQRQASPLGTPAPAAGLHYVTLAVRFGNTSSRQQRADRRDFALRDSLGQQRPPVTSPAGACPAWVMTDLVPAGQQHQPLRDAQADRAGASFGPVPLCFQAGGSPAAPLTLVWDPDISMPFLSTAAQIPLR